MATLIIIDASGYLYASYHAIQNMTNSKGESTNALFGFINSVQKILNSFKSQHVVVVFDGPNNTQARKVLSVDYKATRKESPKDLFYQIGWAKEYCRFKGLSVVETPGVEADDVMASIALWVASQGHDVLICSSDKDMCQIVNDQIKLVHTRKDNRIVDSRAVEEIYGIPPRLMIDYLAIVGDTSDNIPGLPGFGPKTAAALLKEFGSLEAVLDYPEKVSGAKKQETIRQHAEKVRLSKQLVTLDTSVPFEKHSTIYQLGSTDEEGLRQFFLRFDFHSFLKSLPAIEVDQPKEHIENYILVDDEHSFKELLKRLSHEKEVCLDTETTATDPLQADLVGIGFGYEPGKAWYVPLNGRLGEQAVLKGLKSLFAKPSVAFYGHNIKYDSHVLANKGLYLTNISFDTLLCSYLLNSHQRQHSLDALALQYFNKTKTSIEELIGKGKAAVTMDQVELNKVKDYCCEDVDYTVRLKEVLKKQLIERGLDKLLMELEIPLMHILQEMERRGIYVDKEELFQFGQELTVQLTNLRSSIHAVAGRDFNVNSTQQLGQLLGELGIKTAKKTTTGMSTRADELEKIRHLHPIIDLVLEYRSLEKLRSTYVDALPLQINPQTQRIHCHFNQSVTATGRLASQDPNLQNIPVRTEQGLRIRQAFKPQKEGWSFLAADYSQIELRLLAHLSEDERLIEAFQEGKDIHRHTAATIFQVPLEEVTDQQRYQSKTINFGVLYGQQAYGLSQLLRIPQKQAEAFIQTYFQQFPRIQDYLNRCKESARLTGKAVTITGRERIIPEISSKNVLIRTAAERFAINTPLQGTAADLIKIAMLRVDEALKKSGLNGYMILQIHDELIFETPDNEITSLMTLVKEGMENVMHLRVPLEVNIAIGKNWKEC